MRAGEPIAASGQSIEALLARMESRLHRLFTRYRVPPEDTEDILQQGLLALVHQWDRVRSPEAWLLATLRNHCRRYWRDRRRRIYEAMDAAVLEWLAAPQQPTQEGAAFRRDVEAVLAEMPERCSRLLRLRYQLGYEPPEVAARMGYSPASIAKVTRRCLTALTRRLLEPSGLPPSWPCERPPADG